MNQKALLEQLTGSLAQFGGAHLKLGLGNSNRLL